VATTTPFEEAFLIKSRLPSNSGATVKPIYLAIEEARGDMEMGELFIELI
jgi:hypothetical protein